MPRPKKVVPVEPVAPVEPAAPAIDTTITNCLPGTRLHLGDGRVLEHGESAEVGEELATFLRERGQAQ